MKKLIVLTVSLCIYAGVANAQLEKYLAFMKSQVQKLDTADTQEEFLALQVGFERCAQKAKMFWQPYYYAAYTKVYVAYLEKDKTKIDAICDDATFYIDKADSLSPDNSEIYSLKAMIATAKIKVDFMERGMKYVSLSNTLLMKALELDKDNPRAYHLLGQNLYNTPEGLGGGKEKAKKFFEKAESLFAAQLPKEQTTEPHWGRVEVEKRLQQYAAVAKKGTE
jgi:hypothetical protein